MATDAAKIKRIQPCETAVAGCGFAKRNRIYGHIEPPECAAGSAAMCIRFEVASVLECAGEEGTESG
jgi:hypothetical protein